MAETPQKIIVYEHGPYGVEGGIPLVRKDLIKSEHGESLTWRKGETLPTDDTYYLCRCGQSQNKPFCDGTHSKVGFDGTETADTGPSSGRQQNYPGTGIVLKDDRSLCMHAGFCSNQVTNAWQMTQDSGDSRVRAQIIAMVERCPSGALSYALEADGEVIEPDLPKEIALTPDGALWASGGIPVERADGKEWEVRNRVTLCRCGASKNKPLCDGAHEESGFTDA
jgi:CDGSH-type Zn-finger protein